uniref:Uncharacterized protein n=1 Tax=Candidatus Kentrum sp. LPFa TaxID=2126335 RepID=A0A450W3I8_9GAMM|nr:MAG: hypothetical protein BECKLPF1236A_GA0070988_1005713 [Candidatus Kentron sp. LPFa]
MMNMLALRQRIERGVRFLAYADLLKPSFFRTLWSFAIHGYRFVCRAVMNINPNAFRSAMFFIG